YRHAGGAEVIFWSYFDRACKQAGGRAATRALAEVAALERRQAAPLDAIARAADVDETSAARIAAELANARPGRPEAGGITLANDWLRPHARAFTGEARGRRVAALLLLRRKIDSGRLLALGELWEVRRFAGTLSADEERVVRRSRAFGMVIAAVVLGLP